MVAFIAGLFIGVAGDRLVLIRSGQFFPRHAAAFSAAHVVDRMNRDLHFSDAQRVQIQRIIDQYHTRIDGIWNGVRPQVRREIDAANAEIEKTLTPEQVSKFREMRARTQQRRGRHGWSIF